MRFASSPPPGSGWITTPSVEFEYEAGDNRSGTGQESCLQSLAWTLDTTVPDKPLTGVTGTFQVTFPTDGEHFVLVRAIVCADNVQVVQVPVKVDTQSPGVSSRLEGISGPAPDTVRTTPNAFG